jgi:nucleoside-diphosphate-sugar epimerase
MKSNGAVAPAPTPTPAPSAQVIPLSEHDTRLYTCNVSFSVEKARKLLGYQPKIDFAEGMARTAEWIKWMKL